MIGSSNGFTLPHGGAALAGSFGVDPARVLAFPRLSMVPAAVLYPIRERQLVAGLTDGATKE
jgi:ABC-type glycerol-3-phosphate transport system permease component